MKKSPGKARPSYNLGNVYAKMGHYQEEIDAFKQAIRLKPDDTEAHYNLGMAYLICGDKNSARNEYNILKNLSGDLANKLFNLIAKQRG